MGQFPQDGENGQNVAFFYFFWSSAVTKRFGFSTFLNCSEEILAESEKIFLADIGIKK